MRMMDVREKILTTLDRKPGDTFSVSQIARAIGSTAKATNATLSRLFKAGLIARPQKGVYASNGESARKVVAAEPQTKKTAKPVNPVKPAKPAKAVKSQKIAKTATPAPAAEARLSVVTIDVLVEAEQSTVDVGRILGIIRQEKAVLDARVRKITEADQSKLQIRFALADEA
jgi:DNA-binding transcriptional ArsR family regulator